MQKDSGILIIQKRFSKLSRNDFHHVDNWLLSTKNVNPVNKRTYTAKIKPGYVLINEADYLVKNYQGGSMHSKLFRDFTGKDLAWVLYFNFLEII